MLFSVQISSLFHVSQCFIVLFLIHAILVTVKDVSASNNTEVAEFISQNPGFGLDTTWFAPRKQNIEFFRDINGDLRVTSTGKHSYFMLMHLPIFLPSGNFNLHIAQSIKNTKETIDNTRFVVSLVKMESNNEGIFSTVFSKKYLAQNTINDIFTATIMDIDSGYYTFSLECSSLAKDSALLISDVYLTPVGSRPQERAVQISPVGISPVHSPGELVHIGAQVKIAKQGSYSLQYEILDSEGGKVCGGDLGTYSSPGLHSAEAPFHALHADHYLVRYTLSGSTRLVIEKAFSILPQGDVPWLGLHTNGPPESPETLALGRRLGFTLYRDHDFGAYTRWSRLAPKQGYFDWSNDIAIRSIVCEHGYRYLGVLFQTPEWAANHAMSRPDHPIRVPYLEHWRQYVHEALKHYSVNQDLILEWEIWNEGKGVLGSRLNDPSLYIALVEIAADEVTKLKKENPNAELDLVLFAGINVSRIWKDVYPRFPEIAVVSSHNKASRYADTGLPKERRNGIWTPKRDDWMQKAKAVLDSQGRQVDHWETEFGLVNEVRSRYVNTYDIFAEAVGPIPLADRSRNRKIQQDPYLKDVLHYREAAGVFVRQLLTLKKSGISRVYLYHLNRRRFVDVSNVEALLEYDGTLMPHTHALLYSIQMLSTADYAGGTRTPKYVTERFTDSKHFYEFCWSESPETVAITVPETARVVSIFGRPLIPVNGIVQVDELPVIIITTIEKGSA